MQLEQYNLNEEQFKVANDILTAVPKIMERVPKNIEDRIYSISGSSGTGKSYTTSVILKELFKMNYSIKVCATTHRALANINGMLEGTNFQSSTIHSYLKCKVVEDYVDGVYRLQQDANLEEIEAFDIIFCEESSMASAQLYEMIIAELYKGKIKMVIFLGDSAQLPPVEGSSFPIYDGIISCNTYELKTVVRQASDSNILAIANYVRSFIETGEYKPFPEIIKYIKSFDNIEDVITLNRTDLWLKNYASGDMQNSMIGAFKNATVGMYNAKARLLQNDKTRMPFLIEGEKVIFNEVHMEGDETIHANNETVTIIKLEEIDDEANDIIYYRCIDESGKSFKVLDKASSLVVEARLKQLAKDAKKENGSARTALWEQYFRLKKEFQNVIYPYAATFFKLQGLSVDNCYIDLNELNEASKYISLDSVYRQLYVGMTRSRKKVIFMAGI